MPKIAMVMSLEANIEAETSDVVNPDNAANDE